MLECERERRLWLSSTESREDSHWVSLGRKGRRVYSLAGEKKKKCVSVRKEQKINT